MNVLVITRLYPRPGNKVCGIFVYQQVQHLIERGHSVRVVAPLPWTPPYIDLPPKWDTYRSAPGQSKIGRVEIARPRYLSPPGGATIAASTLSTRASLCWWHRNGGLDGFVPDVINAHVALPTGYASVPIARAYDAPLVTTIHGADLQESIHELGAEWLLGRVFDASARVVVNSTKLQTLATESFSGVIPPAINPNGVAMETVEKTESANPPPEIDPEATTVVSVGNLIPTKGHRYLLDAFSRLSESSDTQLVVVGDGSQRETLSDRAEQQGIADSVFFAGQVPNERVFQYLHHADVFALPSYEEGFGIAYLEAMACGLPVIACAGEGPEDFISNGETGYLVPPRDADALESLLSRVVRSPEERHRVGAQAREHVRGEYTWERNAKRIEQVYMAVQ